MRAMAERYGHTYTVTNSPNPDMQLSAIGTQRIWEASTLPLWNAIHADSRLGMVYDMDDDLWNVPDDNPAYHYFANPRLQQGLRDHMGKAHVVTASTYALRDRLYEEMEDDGPIVIVMPNTIPARLLDVPRLQAGSTVRVGWTGSATHQRDWDDAVPYVKRARARHDEMRLLTAGYQPQGLPVDAHLGWTQSLDAHYERLASFDVGLAPLRPSVFNRSKSHIKALEMMALGIPVIASESEAYSGLIVHGKNGLLVRHPHEWTTYLSRLINDPDLRAQMGEEARQTASAYTSEAYADLWNEVYTLAIEEAHANKR